MRKISISQIATETMSCEPLIVRAPNGELLCMCQCGGVLEPAPDNREYVFHSKDNGKTWSKKERVLEENDVAELGTGLTVNGNEITAYISIHNGGFLFWKSVVLKSFDSGYTWQRQPYVGFDKYTLIRNGLATKKGKKMLTYHHFSPTEEQVDQVFFEKKVKNLAYSGILKNEAGILISDDGEKTWKKSLAYLDDKSTISWMEPTIAELSDGTIAMLMRRERSGWLYRCDSVDGGKTWGEYYQTDIPSPTNKPKLLNLDNGKIALLHTPNGELDKYGYGKRFPLELWISSDDMKTFEEKIRLTDFPGEYHYPDAFYEDGHIYMVIEHNRHTILFFDIEL